MINIKQIISSFAIVAIFMSINAFAGSVIITNKATGVDSLSKGEVKALFLKKKKTFPNGEKVIVGDQNEKSDIRKEFSKEVLGKSTKKLKRYWTKRIFSGKGKPPKVIGNDIAMKKWVSSTPNSLGYIDKKSIDSTIKVVLEP